MPETRLFLMARLAMEALRIYVSPVRRGAMACPESNAVTTMTAMGALSGRPSVNAPRTRCVGTGSAYPSMDLLAKIAADPERPAVRAVRFSGAGRGPTAVSIGCSRSRVQMAVVAAVVSVSMPRAARTSALKVRPSAIESRCAIVCSAPMDALSGRHQKPVRGTSVAVWVGAGVRASAWWGPVNASSKASEPALRWTGADSGPPLHHALATRCATMVSASGLPARMSALRRAKGNAWVICNVSAKSMQTYAGVGATPCRAPMAGYAVRKGVYLNVLTNAHLWARIGVMATLRFRDVVAIRVPSVDDGRTLHSANPAASAGTASALSPSKGNRAFSRPVYQAQWTWSR